MFYLLHGPDEFAIAEFVDVLKDKMGDPAMASLNTTVFDGRSVTLPELRGACDAMPFLGSRRLVIVEGWLTKLLGKAEEGEGEASPASSKATSLSAMETSTVAVRVSTTSAKVSPYSRCRPTWFSTRGVATTPSMGERRRVRSSRSPARFASAVQ